MEVPGAQFLNRKFLKKEPGLYLAPQLVERNLPLRLQAIAPWRLSGQHGGHPRLRGRHIRQHKLLIHLLFLGKGERKCNDDRPPAGSSGGRARRATRRHTACRDTVGGPVARRAQPPEDPTGGHYHYLLLYLYLKR